LYYTVFLRCINLEEEINYESRDVSIDYLNLHQYKQEDEFQYVNNSTGDSVFFTYYYTELDISLTNQSSEPISQIDLRSSTLPFLYFSFPQDYSFYDVVLMPGESISIQDTLKRNVQLQDLVYAVPGADFRFNHHENRVVYPNFTADFENVSFDLDLKVYPNPSINQLNINIDDAINTVEIYNELGQLMIFKSGGSSLNTIDVSSLASGNYFLRLQLVGKEAYAIQQFVKI